MGSRVNPQNNWIPYISSRDCTQGICSLYCPRWCYGVFPPPPPLQLLGDDSSPSGPNFSPLIIAIVGVLASAFLLVTYYTVISKFCGSSNPSRTQSPRDLNLDPDGEPSPRADHEPWYVSTGGLDEALIRSIAVCKYKRGSGMIEGTCSVCLSEFQEDESVRLLPKCTHAFHIPCIDTWLKSHSNCPLCRSEVAFAGSFPVRAPLNSAGPQLSSDESVRGSENWTHPGAVDAPASSSNVADLEEATGIGDHATNSQSFNVFRNIRNTDTAIEVRCEGLQPTRRSFSAGHSCQTVADILKEDQDEEDQIQGSTSSTMSHNAGSAKNPLEMCKIGHKRSFLHSMIDRPIHMKGSFSSGRLSLSWHGRAKGIRMPVWELPVHCWSRKHVVVDYEYVITPKLLTFPWESFFNQHLMDSLIITMYLEFSTISQI